MNAVVEMSDQPPVPRPESGTLLQIISRAASDPSVDIEKMERLMQMHERIVAKQAETAFNAAMTDAQSEMGRISADAVNPQTRSNYASYAQLDRHLRPIYTKHGFALSFDEGESPKPEHVRVICHVSHCAGHSRTYHKDMPADGKGAKGGDVMTKTHAAASAMSYGMRYLVKGIFNVAVGEDDDDGNAAGGEPPRPDPEIVPSGKWSGKKWSEVDADYITWAATSDKCSPALSEGAKREMAKRDQTQSQKKSGTEPDAETVPCGKYQGKPWALMTYDTLDWYVKSERTPKELKDGAKRELARREAQMNNGPIDDSSKIPH